MKEERNVPIAVYMWGIWNDRKCDRVVYGGVCVFQLEFCDGGGGMKLFSDDDWRKLKVWKP
jgi:hypothetical protein